MSTRAMWITVAVVDFVYILAALFIMAGMAGCGGPAAHPELVPPQIGKACTAADVYRDHSFCGDQPEGSPTLAVGCLEVVGRPGVCVELCGDDNPPCPIGYVCTHAWTDTCEAQP